MNEELEAAYRAKAIREIQVYGEIEVDNDAKVSLPAEDPEKAEGAYVECWVWVEKPEPGESPEV